MNLSPRQRFWLKVVLAVTVPVWFTAAIPLAILWMMAVMFWEMATDVAGCISPEHNEPDEYAADDVPHPFGDPDALTGNITSPLGAHSFRAIKDAHEDSPQAIDAQSGEVIDVTKGPYVPNLPCAISGDPS